MKPTITKIVIYAKNMEKMIAFYEKHFDFKPIVLEEDRIVELRPAYGGAGLLVHPAGKGMREGQASMKLVFDIEDVEKFKEKCAENGLKFGTIHQADGYVYANAKDPGKNSIQISSRAFRKNS